MASSASRIVARQRGLPPRRGHRPDGDGVEAGVEQLDEQRARAPACLASVASMYGWLNGEADLAQVLGVGAQHRHLAGVEAGEQHEAVEAVALDHALDETGERVADVGRPGVVEHAPRRAPGPRCRTGAPARPLRRRERASTAARRGR